MEQAEAEQNFHLFQFGQLGADKTAVFLMLDAIGLEKVDAALKAGTIHDVQPRGWAWEWFNLRSQVRQNEIENERRIVAERAVVAAERSAAASEAAATHAQKSAKATETAAYWAAVAAFVSMFSIALPYMHNWFNAFFEFIFK